MEEMKGGEVKDARTHMQTTHMCILLICTSKEYRYANLVIINIQKCVFTLLNRIQRIIIKKLLFPKEFVFFNVLNRRTKRKTWKIWYKL